MMFSNLDEALKLIEMCLPRPQFLAVTLSVISDRLKLAVPSGSIGPTPRSIRDTRAGPRPTSRQLLKVSEEQTPHTASGQPVPVLHHLHSTEVLLVFRGRFLCASAGIGHHGKEPG